jgi:hypothetical protein
MALIGTLSKSPAVELNFSLLMQSSPYSDPRSV